MNNRQLGRLGSSLSLLAGLWLFAGTTASGDDGFVLVAHPGVGVDSITRDELSDIFLGNSTRWPGGARAVPVDQGGSSRVRERFSRAVLGQSTESVIRHWMKRIFSGKATPPTTRETDRGILEFVAGTEGAVGYVSLEVAPSGVKVLQVTTGR